MPSAVVLINCEVGREASVTDSLCAIEGVERAYIVYGVYDVVAIIDSPTMEGLEAALMTRVRSLPGVRGTVTLMVSRDCVRGSRAKS
jgi:DNA-binding Lrp family transcriptional regulator